MRRIRQTWPLVALYVACLSVTLFAISITTHTAAHNTDQSGTTATSIVSTSATYSAGSTLDVFYAYYRNGAAAPTVTLTSGVGGTLGGTSGCVSSSIVNSQDAGNAAFGTQAGHCYVYNITGGTGTVTVHFSSAVPYWSVQVIELTPTNTTDPFDVAGIGHDGTGSASSVTTGSFTTTHNSEIVVCGLAAQNTQTWSAGNINGAASTLIESYATTQVGSEYKAVATAATMTGAASIGGTAAMGISCAAFWDGTGGGGTPGCKNGLLMNGVGCLAQ